MRFSGLSSISSFIQVEAYFIEPTVTCALSSLLIQIGQEHHQIDDLLQVTVFLVVGILSIGKARNKQLLPVQAQKLNIEPWHTRLVNLYGCDPFLRR